ncbi:16S rRNA processing protein RimM [Micromonospora pattaloongensis]|uniref:Ribosome maturation factor RimM n=1 Tax=Micromonospora pattaloongensis TaxID=405436 RepID=A0A1H3KQL8_9ACTN|nr:ribosome maturation factor RimM [Micromonospora pattaloongensis]SDY54482.1 16S rRNA processing protein RimM [Micromonospora pattaloongensis]
MLLIVGRIGRPHGIRGELTVEVRTDEPETRFAVGSVLITDPTALPAPEPGGDDAHRVRVPERLVVEAVRWHQGRPLVLFEGVYDRNVAEVLRGVLLCVDSDEVPAPTDPDEFLDHQLVGLIAVSPAGEPLGEVTAIDHAPASDLLVLRRPSGGTALVPFVKEIVPDVDLAAGRVVVDAPPGLLEL